MNERPRINVQTQFIVAAISGAMIFGIGVVASAIDRDHSIGYLAGTGSLMIALLAILKGIAEYHNIINSRLDEFMIVKEKLDRMLGAEQEKKDAAARDT